QEQQAQGDGAQQESHQRPSLPLLRRMNCERHRKAAAQKHHGIYAAEENFGVVTGGGKGIGVEGAASGIRREEAAEENDLGRQKEPHSEGGCLALLLQVIELVGQDGGFSQRGPPYARSRKAARRPQESSRSSVWEAGRQFATRGRSPAKGSR